MNKLLIMVLVCWSSMVVAQQTETRAIGSFSGIKAAEGIDVYLKKGDKESVRVEVTGTAPSNVITEISGTYLKIHMRDGNFKGKLDAKVYVTFVELNKFSASSAGSIFSEGIIKASSIEMSVSSAGTIELNVDAGNIEANASSAGDLEIKGKAKSISAEASSGGEIDAYDLEADDVEAEASSAGSIKVNVVKNLVARASSAGSIRYRGNPDKSNTNSSSGGSVKKSN